MYILCTLSSASYWFQNRDHFIVDLAESIQTGKEFTLKLDKNALWAFFCKTLGFSINILIADCLLVSLVLQVSTDLLIKKDMEVLGNLGPRLENRDSTGNLNDNWDR